MTIEDCNAQIHGKQQAIANSQAAINVASGKISELETLRSKFGNLGELVKTKANQGSDVVNRAPGVFGKVFAKVNDSFFSPLMKALKGEEYSSAIQGMSAAIDRIDEEIRSLRQQIAQNQSTIASCQASIGSLQSERSALVQAQQAQAESEG